MSEGLEARGLVKEYVRRGLPPVRVLDGFDLAARPGELVAIAGASGSGKSTLLYLLGGMLAPDGGTVAVAGVAPWQLTPSRRAAWRNGCVGFVFQASRLLGELTALENVLAPSWIAGEEDESVRAEAHALLDRLGLGARATHHPSELSGGEAQRVAVARALARSPALLLADEPTGNLDRASGQAVFSELAALVRERRVVALVATHDESLASRCDRVVHVEDGKAR